MLTSPRISPLLLPLNATAQQRGLRDPTVLLIENSASGVHELLALSEVWADAEVIRATSTGALDFLETEAADAAIVEFGHDELSARVVRRLKELGIPFLTLTAEMVSRH
jgi:uncharacterized protein (DUF58 family)